MQAFRDTSDGYGVISKSFHWLMAFLFAWQFGGAMLRLAETESAVQAFMWSTHQPVGFTLWGLAFLRACWGIFNWRNRPHHTGSSVQVRLIGAAHMVMYLLMLVVPSLAILRGIGSGRGLSIYGIDVLQPTGVQIDFLVTPANILHGWLAWLLLVLIAGHVFMAMYHQLVRKDGTLSKMV